MTNFAEHLCYRTTQELFYHLLAKPKVLAAKNLPGIGLHANLEENTVPQVNDIKEAAYDVLNEIP